MQKNLPVNKWLTMSIIVSFIFLFLSYIPNIYEASVTDIMPKDRVMLWGEHIYTYDYNVYLSKIRQGMEGRWSVVDKYDNNPQAKGVFLQMLYLLSGKVGGLIKLTPTLIFHFLRTLLSFTWIWIIIYINFYFLKNPKLAFAGVILSLLASSWPEFQTVNGRFWIGMHMPWWQEMDVLKRISYIPHYTFNYIILALLTILLSKSETLNPKSENPLRSSNFEGQANPKYQSSKSQTFSLFKHWVIDNLLKIGNWKLEINSNYFAICLLLFLSFFIHPSGGLLFLISWILYHTIVTTFQRPLQSRYFLKKFVQTLIIFIVATIPLLYIQSVTSNYPWKSLVEYDKTTLLPFDLKEYILALGPIFITGILGAIVVLIKRNRQMLPLATWTAGAFLGIVVFQIIKLQSEVRFVQTANHIPLAILSVYFLYSLKNMLLGLKAKIPVLNDLGGAQIVNIFIYGFILVIILCGIGQTVYSIIGQADFIHQRAVAGLPLVPYPSQVMYPLKDFANAIVWLTNNTSRNDVVLAKITAGNYIPAYTGNFVYLGHNPETPDFWNREAKLNLFFTGTMDEKSAYEFLKSARVSYIFYGPQEKDKAVEDIKKYPFLKPMFSSYYVTLYEVD